MILRDCAERVWLRFSVAELEKLRDALAAAQTGGEEQTLALQAGVERLKAEAAAAAVAATEAATAAALQAEQDMAAALVELRKNLIREKDAAVFTRAIPNHSLITRDVL